MAARRSNLAQVIFGLVLLLAGLSGTAALIAITYGDSAASQSWALRLGLTLSLLFSAVAQTMVLLGGWLLWRSKH
ncbi:hypothetical protein [Phenylobacterium sp.]|uniref:hypothetical protein n=1 Tax=Phenylobacterium sp. TaxID=1871053 RepID=UPI002FC9BE3D